MGRDKSKTPDDENGAPVKKSRKNTSESEPDARSESDEGSKRSERSSHSKRTRSKRKRSRSSSRKPRDDGEEDSYTSSSSESDSYSDSESGSSDEYSESEDERRRRKRRERKKREEKERRRTKEKEKKRRRKEREEKEKKRRKKKKEKKKKKDKEKGKTGAVTNSWGKYGIIRETDMWNKRPEFTAWLGEVKQVNLESLANWEEKQMFKEFMEDHNTATFPSKKYYDLDTYHRRQMEKEMKRGTKIPVTERTVFNDEEQRRQEMLRERERQKEVEIEALKHSMQSGMAQAMKEQAQLREEMAYQYKIGNFEAAAAIQRRLDPDVAM